MTCQQQITQLNHDGMAACNEGRTDDAIIHLIQAERLARKMQSSGQEARVRNNIGLFHQMNGNAEEALVCLRLAERAAVKGEGQGSKLHKIIVRNLSRLERAVEQEAA